LFYLAPTLSKDSKTARRDVAGSGKTSRHSTYCI